MVSILESDIKIGSGSGGRTHGLLSQSQVLYPAKLFRNKLARERGIEPLLQGFGDLPSAVDLFTY